MAHNPALKFDHCRTIGHAWVLVQDPEWTPRFGFPLVFDCAVCTMQRRDAVSRFTGEVLSRQYVAPVDYHMSRDEQMPRTAWRVVYMDRQFGPARKPRARKGNGADIHEEAS